MEACLTCVAGNIIEVVFSTFGVWAYFLLPVPILIIMVPFYILCQPGERFRFLYGFVSIVKREKGIFSRFRKGKILLGNHILFKRFNSWIKETIPNMEVSGHIKGLLSLKFDLWSEVLRTIAEDKEIKKLSNDELYKYLLDKTNATIDLCEKRWEKYEIPPEVIDKFNKNHDDRTNMVKKEIKNVCYSETYSNPLEKVSVFFHLCVAIFSLTIIDAEKTFKDDFIKNKEED